jgi:outer membrane protein TolC
MRLLLVLLLITANHFCIAQNKYTLQQFITIATNTALDTKLAKENTKLTLLQNRAFYLQKKPIIELNGNLPLYDKDNFSVRQPDGSIKFLNRTQSNSNINVSIIQPILKTGGSLSFQSNLFRFDNFVDKTKQYSGTPFYIQYAQPLFAFNNYKWQLKTAPLQLQIAALKQQQSYYDIALEASTLFFNIAGTLVDEKLITDNLNNLTTLQKAEDRKKQLGVGSIEKIIQLQTQKINIEQQLLQLKMSQSINHIAIKKYIADTGFATVMPIILDIPIPTVQSMWDSIIKNNANFLQYTIDNINLNADKERLQKEKTNVQLLLSYGLNQSGATIGNIYTNPNDQQRFNISFKVPIANFGRNKNIGEQIEERQKINAIQQLQVEQQIKINLEQVLLKIHSANNAFNWLTKLDVITNEKMKLFLRNFELGKITFLELQNATAELNNIIKGKFDVVKEYYLNILALQKICCCKLL